jgi:hypothetical protein
MCVQKYSSTFSTHALGDEEGSVLVPTAVLRGNSSRHPLNGKLDGSKGQSGRFGEETNLLLLPGLETRFLGRPIHNLVITLNVLSLLFGYLQRRQKCHLHPRVLRFPS